MADKSQLKLFRVSIIFMLLTLLSLAFSMIEKAESHYFEQKLDHFDHRSTRTFNQRYFLNDSFREMRRLYQPVVIVIGGFHEFESSYLDSPAIRDLIFESKSSVFGLEHRFFGNSSVVIEDIENYLQYITVEQALADIASFLTFINTSIFSSYVCQFALVGIDYGASLATWFKMKYPQYANCIWASSPLLISKKLLFEPDLMLGSKLIEYNEKCYNDVYDQLNNIILLDFKKEQYDMYYDIFNMSRSISPTSFLYIICEALEEIILNPIFEKEKNQVCQGFNINKLTEIVTKWKLDYFAIDPQNLTYPNKFIENYVKCNQLGWFKIGMPIRGKSNLIHSVRPYWINSSYYEDICYTNYNLTLKDNDGFNLIYGNAQLGLYSAILTYGEQEDNVIYAPTLSDDKNEAQVISTGNHRLGADIQLETSDDRLLEIRSSIVHQVTDWINDSCLEYCVHGYCILHRCVCEEDYSGTKCDMRTTPLYKFKLLSAACVSVPTLIIMIFGCVGWVFITKQV